MLLRISGGIKGIREYLETGKMQGREKSRDELDDRLILAGSLDLLDAVIAQKEGKGDRYLHITLSFLEDSVSRESLQLIVEHFRDFAFAAYRPEEYFYYAEAHLPRTKTLIDKKTGAVVPRKPHIHIVIPKINILSGRYLEPFGKVTTNIRYLDAWQESINCEFGFASPKDHKRTSLAGRSDMVSRYSGDTFLGGNRDIKEALLGEILKQNISSQAAFMDLCSSRGFVRIRNSGTDRAYINLRLEGEEKGINLKEYVFSEAFLSLPSSEKERRIQGPPSEGYCDVQNPRYLAENDRVLVREWMERRARETRWLHTGRKAEYRRYHEGSRETQEEILAKRERSFYEAVSLKTAYESETWVIQEVAKAKDPVEDSRRIQHQKPKIPTDLQPTSVISDFAERWEEEKASAKGSANELIQEAKKNIDLGRLFQELEKKNGILRNKYTTEIGSDGLTRIVCGARHYTVADFLTKEMGYPWHIAANLLCSTYAQQVKEDNTLQPKTIESWNHYEWIANSEKRFRQGLRENLGKESRQKFELARQQYRARKDALYKNIELSKRSRANQLSILRVEYLATQERIREAEKLRLFELSKQERESIAERYNKQLTSQHTGVDTKPSGQGKSLTMNEDRLFAGFFVGMGMLIQPKESRLFSDLVANSRTDGSIDYFRDGRRLVGDTVKAVLVYEESPDAIEVGLRMALLKYGPNLHVMGSDTFKDQVVKKCVELRLTVQFDEVALQSRIYDFKSKMSRPRGKTI